MCNKVLLALWVCWASVTTGFAAEEALVRRYEVEGLAGDVVQLPCEVDRASCGDFHSIKWYKDSDRVYIFSDMADVRRAEGPLLERTDFHYAANGTDSSLEIKPLHVEDEGTYKCEITYLAVQEACSVVQFVNLTTYAMPTYPQMWFEDGSPVGNGTTVGPFDEGVTLTLSCESGGGKPVARVSWWNGTQELAGEYSSVLEADGSGLGRNVLRLPVARGDLDATLTCEAVNPALSYPFTASVTLDVNVPPLGVEVMVGETEIHEGDIVVLYCVARGAKPAATLTWLNDSIPLSEVETNINVEVESTEEHNPDNTFTTRSRLQFDATRFENGQTFKCEATNDVLENRRKDPMSSQVTLDVRYAPIVRVTPENITVNESTDILMFCQYSANPVQLTHVNWFQDKRLVDVAGNKDKYGNGDVNHPTLLIRNSSASDMGNYTCRVSNEVGVSDVVNSVDVSVLYRPQVQVIMDPTEPVSEEDSVNVTLFCDVVRANPETLVRVRWYLEGGLLKELPECDSQNSSLTTGSYSELFCDIDPSRLLLQNVFKDFQGNYSCEGMNEAGWGQRSSEAEVIVHYRPGQASILHHPKNVVKGQSLELICNVDDPGRPAATTFTWYRGSHLVQDETSATWTINPVSLETNDNFTCVPVNSEGEGERAYVSINVLAAPSFIDRLQPYHGALMNSAEVSLSCRVECSPLCNVSWFKDDELLLNQSHYDISSKVMKADSSSGDLESVMSTLTWRMGMWRDGILDREKDNANFTCTSSDNEAGPGVTSNTFFRVEYPPEEIIVSNTMIQIIENERPPKVDCRASSYPEATYVWQHNGETVSKGSVLVMDFNVRRNKAGEYQCIAQNRHGQMTASTAIDVLFKPECKIDRIDGGSGEDTHILLICRAEANPQEVQFRWRMGNETLIQDVISEGLESRLRLPATTDSLATYSCFVNNTIGESIACEIDVTGIIHPGDDSIIVISAIVAAVIILVIIICVVIILICRRQRQAGKYPEGAKPPPTGPKDNGIPSPTDDDNKQTFYENLPFHGMQPPPNKEHPASGSVGAGGSRPPSQLSQQASSGYGSTRSRKEDVNLNQSCAEEGSKVSGKRDGTGQAQDENGFNRVKRQNSESYGSMRSTKEKPAKSALARTAAYFSMRLPGAKRKTKNKNSTEENHQMIHKQPPIRAVPSKDGSAGPSISPLREDPNEGQQTAHFTSETKHIITSQPDSNILTVESSQSSKLTVLSRPQSRAESNNNSIYNEGSVSQGFPRPPSSNKVTINEPSSDPRTSDVTGDPDTLPVAAPRNGGGGDRVRHTYQNIPLPTKDKCLGGQQPAPHQLPPLQPPYSSFPENRKNTNYGTAQNPTPSSSPSSSSPSSSHYQYQPHYQRNHHPSLYKQYPSSSSLKEPHHPTGSYNSSSSRQSYSSSTYPHRLENQSHPSTSYPNSQSHPATSYPNSQPHTGTSYPNSQPHTATSYPSSQPHAYPPNSQQPSHHKFGPGVVYADLKLPRNGHPNQYRRDLNTEYAILQFNGPIVGQEIDV